MDTFEYLQYFWLAIKFIATLTMMAVALIHILHAMWSKERELERAKREYAKIKAEEKYNEDH